LQGPRFSDPEQVSHHHAKVEPACLDQQSLEDIGVTPQIRASHPTRVVHVSEASLNALTPFPAQVLTAFPVDMPSVGKDRIFCFRVLCGLVPIMRTQR